jgi:hypothetical protein
VKYKDLLRTASEFEDEIELTECIYFGAIEKLSDVRKNLNELDDIQHVRRIIKPFLIQWGMMGRSVGQKGLDWKRLGDTLRSLEKDFDVLRNRKFLTVDFDERSVSTAIKNIFNEIRSIPYIGGHTSTPKIMHLLNPEIFVMWDKSIRETYEERNSRITDSPRGYLEFLKETQKELKKLFGNRQNETGKDSDEVEKEIRVKFKNKTLARIIDEYNWILAHPSFLSNSSSNVPKT